MTAYLDIAAMDFKSWKKGDIIGIAIEGKQCTESTSGRFVCIEITDATREEVHHFVNDWLIDFVHILVAQNAAGWRFRIEVDPIYISVSDVGKAELKQAMADHVSGRSAYWEGCSVVSFTSSSITVDIPKDGVWQTANQLTNLEYLKLLRDDFSDIFKIRLDISRYHVSEADVDTAIAAGGKLVITKAQALNNILDRLEE